MRQVGSHRFLSDEVSVTDPDFPPIHGYRQVTDAHLIALARRNSVPLITFDSAIAEMAGSDQVTLLTR